MGNCGQTDCMICISKDKKKDRPTTCRQESVCYLISCDRCKEGKVKSYYYGETARTPYLRGREHLKGQQKEMEDNPMWKHDWAHHDGHKGSYSMNVLGSHKTPMKRQIHRLQNYR